MSAVDSPAGYLEIIEEAFATPTSEHAIEVHSIAERARGRWLEAREARLTVAERIADRAAFDATFDPADLEDYRVAYVAQLEAKRSFSLAAEELIRAIEVAE